MRRKICTVLLVAFLLGGIILPSPSIGKPIQFTLCLEGEEEVIKDVEVYLEGDLVGKTDKNGCINCSGNTQDTSHSACINFTLKKEGYRDQSGGMMVLDDQALKILIYMPSEISPKTPELIPDPTPEFTPEPTVCPTVPPLPEGYKSPAQRLTELENATAEHEQRLTWLEEMVQKIRDFLITLGFKK